jgi:glycosyltransferase involved in cell wall biosynthesis
MTIAFFNYLPLEYGGGLATFYKQTALALKKRYPELTISIITLSDEAANSILRMYSLYFLKHPIKKNDSFHAIKRSLPDISYHKAKNIKELRTILSTFDRIYTKNDLLELSLLRFFIGYRRLPPVIIGFHTPIYYEHPASIQARLHNVLYNSLYYRFLLVPAAAYHVLNKAAEKRLKQSVTPKKVIRLANPSPYSIHAIKKRTKRSDAKTVILWAGRLTEQKGVNDLATLIRRINSQNTDVQLHWIIAGDGELRSMVVELQKRYGNVEYRGYIPPDKMPAFYRSGDIFITTSRWESLPYTLLEALSFSLPLVGYDIAGNNDIINRKNGILVSTISEFADTIISMSLNPLIPDTTGLKEIFSGNKIYPRMYRLFTDL